MTLPTLPLVDQNQLADAGNLSMLKRAAAQNSPQALREAAKQFESLFTSMMLKSMRQANFKDPLFGSDQGDLYQDMYDDQIAAVMSKGKGLGLADMLVQQLRRETGTAADSSSASGTTRGGNATSGSDAIETTQGSAATRGTRPGATETTTNSSIGTRRNNAATNTGTTGSTGTTAVAGSSGTACPTSTQQAAFARTLWPDAQQAARQLGVSPVTLLAQAALETNWGRDMPQNATGGTSNNLFGIKAGSGWSGPAASNSTQEYSGGVASTVKAQFRSYGSSGQCFQDYVDLLKSNPRYAAALGTGNDVQAFGSALQQGGYATDPAYASKLTAVAGTLTRAMTQGLAGALAPGGSAGAGSGSSPSLKFATGLPTTSGSGTLQRR